MSTKDPFAIDLKGKYALVTGSAVRLGRAFALALANEGCHVAVHYRSKRKEAEQTAHRIEALGLQAPLIQADFEDPNAPRRIATELLERFPAVDILVNNAGSWSAPKTLSASHGLLDETFAEWERNMAVNCRAPFFLMQALAPALKRTSGSIINILDQSVSYPYLDRSSHSISKAALLSATRIAARTLAPDIRVNSLEFGAIIPPDEMPSDERERWSWGGEESAVSALLFVLKNRFINGEVIPVRGDYHLVRKL